MNKPLYNLLSCSFFHQSFESTSINNILRKLTKNFEPWKKSPISKLSNWKPKLTSRWISSHLKARTARIARRIAQITRYTWIFLLQSIGLNMIKTPFRKIGLYGNWWGNIYSTKREIPSNFPTFLQLKTTTKLHTVNNSLKSYSEIHTFTSSNTDLCFKFCFVWLLLWFGSDMYKQSEKY